MSAESTDLFTQVWMQCNETGDYDPALAFFKAALKEGNPDAAGNLVEVGDCYRNKKSDFGKAFDCYDLALAHGCESAKVPLIGLSMGIQGELDKYFTQKAINNECGIGHILLVQPSNMDNNHKAHITKSSLHYTFFGQAPQDDIQRVEIAKTIMRKLVGEEREKKFSREEIDPIFSSDRMNDLFTQREHSWVGGKLRNEWAAEPPVQNNVQGASPLRNIR